MVHDHTTNLEKDERRCAEEKAQSISNGEADFEWRYLNEKREDDLMSFMSGTNRYFGRIEEGEISIIVPAESLPSILAEGDRIGEEMLSKYASKTTGGCFEIELEPAYYEIELNTYGEVERKERYREKTLREKKIEAFEKASEL
jgi:hypothetical protein